MQKIMPYLWFDDNAEEAADLYTSLFANSAVGQVTRYDETTARASGRPAGFVLTISFTLAGQEFGALNGGPVFKFTPAVSFFVNCDTSQEINALWERLSDGGEILMPLDKYPFSECFGWTNDRFGVSWQLNLASPAPVKITPYLMFVGDQSGRAEEAVNFYTSLFENSSIATINYFGPGETETEGTVSHARFFLDGQQFMAMDSRREHAFSFNEALSFMVNCDTQAEVDRLWDTFTGGGEEGQCGWLKDPFGVSWQIVPSALGDMLSDPDPDRSQRVAQAMLQMKKLDIRALQAAYER
jgi:predicted 3-demethylubiquinone-9 3-methyltransferase (glyoxalase superfamily)